MTSCMINGKKLDNLLNINTKHTNKPNIQNKQVLHIHQNVTKITLKKINGMGGTRLN